MPKTDRFFSLHRLTLLVLTVVLCFLALKPSLTSAAACTNGSVQTVYTSIVCCGDTRLGPKRNGERQTCENGQWVTTATGCFNAPICAE